MAVELFEPRLEQRSRETSAHRRKRSGDGTLEFTIDAQLWGYPLPQQLELQSAKYRHDDGGYLRHGRAPRPAAPVAPAMDPRLLEYYNRELQFMRETGAEFARAYPRVAARLGLDELECADPYVERLLERLRPFLAARVQLKLDARHPQFTRSADGVGVSGPSRAPVPAAAVSADHAGSGGRLTQGRSAHPTRQLVEDTVGRRESEPRARVRYLPGRHALACDGHRSPSTSLERSAVIPVLKGSLRVDSRTRAAIRLRLAAAGTACPFSALPHRFAELSTCKATPGVASHASMSRSMRTAWVCGCALCRLNVRPNLRCCLPSLCRRSWFR